MPSLLLGPLLRHVDETSATVWVETDAPCEVQVLGCSTPTFTVAGHHYALVVCGDLEPGTTTPYAVRLDGEQAWPLAGRPVPAADRPDEDRRRRRAVPAACSAPAGSPARTSRRTRSTAGKEGVGIDALHAYGRADARAARSRTGPTRCCSSATRSTPTRCRRRRSRTSSARAARTTPPGDGVADFEEYTLLYREAWSDPLIRWVLSTLPTAMVFDDHDVHDDWNTSAAVAAHDAGDRLVGRPASRAG